MRDLLQTTLGNSFVIERELGGGGMSRVFVADEIRLSRKVAIKVLSPELAQGLNADRFEREILLAASLQQANIVPVLAAGDLNGLPYFTMPFVEGESLRSRLTGTGLPIPDVLAILRDVTKALAYAHARGIVHRDIKPDNVLLSGGTAVVTDFGIAKALSASRTATTGATLTSVGTSIGTPAYMAPEQIAGDPSLDHRVDLYAFGCMAYELLTGKSPFADRPPQKMLAAHLSETPVSVSVSRSDCPSGLVLLISRLLQKDPADRPQSASEVLRVLDSVSTTSAPLLTLNAPGMLPKILGVYVLATVIVAIVAKASVVGIGLPDWVFPGAVGIMLLGLPALLVTAWLKRLARNAIPATPTLTPGGSSQVPAASTMTTLAVKASPYISMRRTARLGAYVMGAFVLVVAAFMALRAAGIGPWGSLLAAGTFKADSRIVLADFTATAEDSALAPIVAEAVRAAMSQSTSSRVVDKSEIAVVLQQMQQPKGTPILPAVAREIATRVGAGAVLNGQLAHAGSGYAVSLELVNAADGVSLASFQGIAEGAKDLLPAVDKLARKLRGKIGESLKRVQHSIPLERATTVSLDALRKYSEASQANDVDQDYDRAVRLLREAVALDSSFALAWRKLSAALTNAGGTGAAKDSALERAARYADRLPDREKYLVLGAYYDMHRVVADRGKALAAYQAAYAADSNSSVVMNQLTTIFATRRQFDSAEKYSRRKMVALPVPASAMGLATGLATIGRTSEASAIIDSLIKAVPASATSRTVLVARYEVYDAQQQRDSAIAIATQLANSSNPAVQLNGLTRLASQAQLAGHLTRAVELGKQFNALIAERGGIGGLPGYSEAAHNLLFRGKTAEAIRQMDAIVAGKEWSSRQPTDRAYLGLGAGYAYAGRPDKARQMLARFQAEDPISAKARSSLSQINSLLAEIALAEGNGAEAIRLFRAADIAEDGAPVTCGACTAFDLARAFEKNAQPDSAIAEYEHYLSYPVPQRNDPTYLASTLKRLGELYDSKHDRTNAIKHYVAFVELWKDADADLQPAVATVRKRLNELRGQEGK